MITMKGLWKNKKYQQKLNGNMENGNKKVSKSMGDGKEVSRKSTNKGQYPDQKFKEYVNQLASPNYQGGS